MINFAFGLNTWSDTLGNVLKNPTVTIASKKQLKKLGETLDKIRQEKDLKAYLKKIL